MKRLFASAALVTLLLYYSGEALAAGSRAPLQARRLNVGEPVLAVSSPRVFHNHNSHHIPGRVYSTHPFYYHPPYYGHYYGPGIIVAPTYRYPYYHSYHSPAATLLSSPFFCFTHHEGFVSRIGFIDHVSGTHKIPINTVAAICPESNESCVID
jgi:hypothetical protein